MGIALLGNNRSDVVEGYTSWYFELLLFQGTVFL